MGNPLQAGGVQEVLHDRDVEIDGALLEHHAELGEGAARVLSHLRAEDADAAGTIAVQPGDQVEQRGLAGAVLAEQHGEAAGRDHEAHAIQRLALAETVRQALDLKGRHGRARLSRSIAHGRTPGTSRIASVALLRPNARPVEGAPGARTGGWYCNRGSARGSGQMTRSGPPESGDAPSRRL
jgi:hypothetical protein